MDIENENNKELNLLTPLTNILNSIISLNQQKYLKILIIILKKINLIIYFFHLMMILNFVLKY